MIEIENEFMVVTGCGREEKCRLLRKGNILVVTESFWILIESVLKSK